MDVGGSAGARRWIIAFVQDPPAAHRVRMNEAREGSPSSGPVGVLPFSSPAVTLTLPGRLFVDRLYLLYAHISIVVSSGWWWSMRF